RSGQVDTVVSLLFLVVSPSDSAQVIKQTGEAEAEATLRCTDVKRRHGQRSIDRNYDNRRLQPTRREVLRGQSTAGRSLHAAHTGNSHRQSLLKMSISALQPLGVMEGASFLEFVRALNPDVQVPTKEEIRSELFTVYQSKEKELRSSLASADDVVLTCELWSSRPEDPYLTVYCHLVDRHGNHKSNMLQTISLSGDKSATNIKKQLSAVMEAWGVKEKVHCVVRAGMPQMKDVKVEWTDMPCFAETLDEVCKDLKRNNELASVLTKCQNIIRFFKNNSEAERNLREIQQQLNVEPKELGLSEQYRAMVVVLNDKDKTDFILNEEDKKKLNNLISALKPLKEATSAMKSGFQTISGVLPLLMSLMDKLKEKGRNNDVAQMILAIFAKKFGDVNNHQLASSTFLDPRYRDRLTETNKKQALEKIMKELAAGRTCSSPQKSKFKALLDKYMASEESDEGSNPLAWWRITGKAHFGELSQLALKKLGVVSTAVPFERAFSKAGDQFHSFRGCIEPEDLNVVLFLNSNWT
ncbi:hypothetical protein INR49_019478, partial [Caranx melampygus]